MRSSPRSKSTDQIEGILRRSLGRYRIVHDAPRTAFLVPYCNVLVIGALYSALRDWARSGDCALIFRAAPIPIVGGVSPAAEKVRLAGIRRAWASSPEKVKGRFNKEKKYTHESTHGYVLSAQLFRSRGTIASPSPSPEVAEASLRRHCRSRTRGQ